jgi:hypothetical protein
MVQPVQPVQPQFRLGSIAQAALRLRTILMLEVLATLLSSTAAGQVLLVDQAAGVSSSTIGHVFYSMETNAPMGQMFTPLSNAVGFVQLGMGARSPVRLHIHLRGDSLTGPILATSRTINIPAGFKGVAHFNFETNVAVAPGWPYCIEPINESTNDCSVTLYHYGYSKGVALLKGTPLNWPYGFWFREGAIASFPKLSGTYLRRDEPDRFHVTLAGLNGEVFVSESSVDGVTWVRFQTNRLTASPMDLVFTNTTTPWRLYRVTYPVP